MLTVFAIVATLVIVTLLSTNEERHEEFWSVIGRGFKAVISGVKSIGRRGGSAGKLAKGGDDALAVGGKQGNIAQEAGGAASAVNPAADVAAGGSRNMLSSGLRRVGGGVKGVGKSIKKNPWEFLSVALTIPFLATMFSPVGSQEEGDAEGGNGPNQIMSLLSVVSSSCFCFFCVSMLIAASSASSASSA